MSDAGRLSLLDTIEGVFQTMQEWNTTVGQMLGWEWEQICVPAQVSSGIMQRTVAANE